ncbi:MAG: hypothetical protein ACXVCV_04550 [Polyangia bacterium]
MKPIEEAADIHADFAGDESTSVMGVDLLSSLTERSRRIDISTAAVPEPEISIAVEEPEPQLLIVDDEYPVIGDEESTMMMEEPEPTTVAVRSHIDKPLPLPEPAPVPPLRVQPLPAAAPPEPRWTASLAPRPLETLRVAPLPTPEMETLSNREPAPSAGSRRLRALAAATLSVAATILGLGHHQPLPASAISSSALPVTSAVVEPWDVQTQVKATIDSVRASLAALVQWSASDASARNESADPGHAMHRPAARHRQRG